MALSVLPDTAPNKGLTAMALRHSLLKDSHNHGEPMDSESSPARDVTFQGMLNPGHLFPGFMSPLALHASLASNPGLFHPFAWPPTPTNHVTSSSSVSAKTPASRKKKRKEDVESAPLSPPTSGSSPQSTGSAQEVVSSAKIGVEKQESREKVFTCGICNRSFGYKHVLQNHERTHTGEKPFECVQCHKRFTRDHHLKTHMRLHTGEKPYHCTHCDRHFVQVANLRRHLRVHTGERPYACELCASRFSDSNQLKAHMLIHKGEKPFHCVLCDNKFRRRHHLMHHKCHGKDSHEYVDRTFSSPVYVESGFTPSPYHEHDDLEEVEDEEEDEEQNIIARNNNSTKRIRERKSKSVIRYQRLPAQILPVSLDLPEQTEPEDLSMSSHRHNNNNSESPHSEEDDHYHYRHLKFRKHQTP